MKYSTQIKPISYLKANAAEVVRHLTEQREPLVITQNGEAKLVIRNAGLTRKNFWRWAPVTTARYSSSLTGCYTES